MSDWVEPEEVFAAVAARHARVFWLDGGGARDWSGRFSYLGWLEDDDVSLTYDAGARRVTEHHGGGSEEVGDDIFAVLDERVRGATGSGFAGWVGWFGYACRPDLPARLGTDDVPDAAWLRVDRYLEFDHVAHTLFLHGLDGPPTPSRRGCASAPPLPTPSRRGCASAPLAGEPSGWSQEQYAAAFTRVQEQLRAGNSYEVNLTYRLTERSRADPALVYLRLRTLNPAPYAAYIQHDDVAVLSSSPERFASVDADRTLETRPIKGSTPRHDDADLDAMSRDQLCRDPKLRAENLIVVDLLRNDLSMVCQPGTVEVPDLMHVESYPSVHQLVTTIRGRLRDDVSTVTAIRALFPAGSMTGAPKLRTMGIIEEVEDTPRGVYAGALGWVGDDGRADLGVVIRTLVAGRGTYSMGTGGGITVRSDVDQEYAETTWKAARLLTALRHHPNSSAVGHQE